MKKISNTALPKKQIEKEQLINSPEYPASDDIYIKFKKESLIDPEDISKNTGMLNNSKVETHNKKDVGEDDDVSEQRLVGDGLDVPGSELDDEQEMIGSEDEENNYYSLGSDNHDDLEENKG